MGNKTTQNNSAPFQSIADTARITGLSRYQLRMGCKSGEYPHILSGKKYLVNVPALLKQLGAAEYVDIVMSKHS